MFRYEGMGCTDLRGKTPRVSAETEKKGMENGNKGKHIKDGVAG